MNHSNLNFHHAQVDTPRVTSSHFVKQLAEQALKHVPGSADAIERAFSTKPIVPELLPKKPMNLVMHMPH